MLQRDDLLGGTPILLVGCLQRLPFSLQLGLNLGGRLALIRLLLAQRQESLVEGPPFRFECIALRFYVHKALLDRYRVFCSL